jgi:heme-degrading monooxygenase HmoA
MIFKWIHCKVLSENKKAFSDAQSRWGDISKAQGFIGQFGGWDLKNLESACIISLWEDEKSFDDFMSRRHDNIVNQNNQSSTYYECNIYFLNSITSMHGEHNDLIQAIPEGRYMRVADCQVKEDRKAHFEEAQRNIWIPEMAKSEGMLGGQFSIKNDENRYFVTTLWDSKKNHAAYVDEKVSGLRKKADVSNDLNNIIGRFIELEKSWLVLPVK